MTHPKFSVIIPTYRRPGALARCIEAIADQTLANSAYEIIIVDDAAEADRLMPAMHLARGVPCRLLTQRQRGAAAARNAGASVARGQFLAFTDDDCRPTQDWLSCLDRRLARLPGNAMVGGQVINALSCNIFACATQTLVDYLYLCFNTDPESAHLLTSNNCCVPADQFRKLGGFDESFRGAGGEDRELCLRWRRAGNHLVYAPEAVVYHAHALTFCSYLRQHVAYGRGSATLRLRALESGNGPVPLESAAFYRNLVRHPFRCAPKYKPWRQSLLLALSQAATCLGHLAARFEQRIHCSHTLPANSTTTSPTTRVVP